MLQGDVHGCPFKTLEKDALAAALSRMRIAPQYVSEAVTKAKAGHYQLACGVVFEGQHGGCACDAGINHPNQARHMPHTLLLCIKLPFRDDESDVAVRLCLHKGAASASEACADRCCSCAVPDPISL